MPTYEYCCAQGHHFEQVQRMTEPPVEKCPTCGAPAERLLSAGTGILFKGSGFYITDNRSDSYKKAAAAEDGTSGGDSSKTSSDGTSTPAKTEKKADTGAKSSPSGE